MRSEKVIVLLACTVALTPLYELFLFDPRYQPETQTLVVFWSNIGLDLTKKYDLFLWFEMEQYLHWYAQYTKYLLSISILSYIIYSLVRNSANKPLVIASKVVLFFSIFRVISYWLFRGSIEFEIICTAITAFLILIVPKWRH